MKEMEAFTLYEFIIANTQYGYLHSYNGKYEIVEDLPENFVPEPYERHQINKIYLDDDTHRYFEWDWDLNSIVMYTEDPENIPEELEGLTFKMFTVQGEPIMEYKGERLRGYREISNAIYGKFVPDIERRISHLLKEDDFDPDKLKVFKEIDQGSYKYTLYKYDGVQEIKGLEGLKRRFPNTNPDAFKQNFPPYLERHEKLIRFYQIQRFGRDYIINNDKVFTSQQKLVDHLKEEYGETVSTYTKLKIFQNIPNFNFDRLIEHYKLEYDKPTRTCDFIIDGQFYPDQKIGRFLELLPFEPYEGLRDDLINYLS